MPMRRDELKDLARRRAEQDKRNEEAVKAAAVPQADLRGMSALEQAEYFASKQVPPNDPEPEAKAAAGPEENKSATSAHETKRGKGGK